MNLMPFDELNTLRATVEDIMSKTADERKGYKEFLEDEILDLLILSYVFGNKDGNEMLSTDIAIDRDSLDSSVYKKINGENWKDRFDNYFESGTADDIMRVADTDSHRIYNDAVLNVGDKAEGNVYKTWQTMLDDRVRDTHDYLEGMTVPISERFYTFDGDSARYPGDFDDPANNVNCRCGIVLTR